MNTTIILEFERTIKNEQVEKLTRELNIQPRSCIGSFIYLYIQ